MQDMIATSTTIHTNGGVLATSVFYKQRDAKFFPSVAWAAAMRRVAPTEPLTVPVALNVLPLRGRSH